MRVCFYGLRLQSCCLFIRTVRPSLIDDSSLMRRLRRCQSSAWLYEASWSSGFGFYRTCHALRVSRRQRVDAPMDGLSHSSLGTSQVQTQTTDGSVNPLNSTSDFRQHIINGLPSSAALPSSALSESSAIPLVSTGLTTTVSSGEVNHEQFNSSWGISEALFGLTDMNTGPITCVPHRERIAAPRMPLFPEWAKRMLFVDSQWLEQFDRLREAGLRGKTTTAEAPSLGSSPVEVPLTIDFTREENNMTPTNSISTPESSSLPCEVAMNDGRCRGEACENSTFRSSTANGTFPPLYADVLGRPKIVRCLLYNFLAQPTYWSDAVDEILRLAAEKVRECGGGSDNGCTDFELSGWTSKHLLQPMEYLVFYSPGLREVFRRVLDRRPESFMGASAIWYAFVMTHRQDATLLRSPHQRPFSFAEVNPMFTPHDFDYRTFDLFRSDSTMASSEREGETTPRGFRRDRPLDALTEAEWKGMPETQQIELLFGKDAVSELAAATMTILKGHFPKDGDIFICNPPSTDPLVTDNGGGSLDLDNSPGLLGKQSNLDAEGNLTPQTTTREALLEQRRHEVLRSYAYELDQFLLGIVECTPDYTIKEPNLTLPQNSQPLCEEKQREAAPARARRAYTQRDRYYANGLLHSAKSGEIEDVHLAQLWKAFQDTDISTLLDHWAHVRSRLHLVQRELRAEIAVQAAFLLLFFSRDEVRAVTNPKDTYHRLWGLHQELVEMLRPASRKAALPLLSDLGQSSPSASTEAVLTRAESPQVQFLPFESLPPTQKVSYACFGCDHLPGLIHSNTPQDAVRQCNINTIEKPKPFALFCGYCAAMSPTHETCLYSHDDELQRIPIRDLTPEQMRIAYQSLTPLQKLAIRFCFPHSLGRRGDPKLLRASQISNAVVDISKEIEISDQVVFTSHSDANELAESSESIEKCDTEAELSENPSKTKESEISDEQLDVISEIPKVMPLLRAENLQKDKERLVHDLERSFVKEKAASIKQKTTDNDNTHSSELSAATPPSPLTGMIIALTNSIHEARLGDQLQQIAENLVRLVVKGLKTEARESMKRLASSRSKDCDPSPSSKTRKRGRPRKSKV